MFKMPRHFQINRMPLLIFLIIFEFIGILFCSAARADIRGKTIEGKFRFKFCIKSNCGEYGKEYHAHIYLGEKNAFDYTGNQQGSIITYGRGVNQIMLSTNSFGWNFGQTTIHTTIRGAKCQFYTTANDKTALPGARFIYDTSFCRVINGHTERSD